MVLAMDPNLKDLLTPLPQIGEKCGYESCPPLKDGWLNVHIVPHSHAEMGLSKTFEDYYSGDSYGGWMKIRANWKTILDSTISELWVIKDRRLASFRTFFASQKGFARNKKTLRVRRMVYELIRQGRLVFVGGGWGMHDEASTSYQAIIDSYTYSLRKINATFLSCGRPLVGWQADTFGHSREYTSLVAQMGFDGLFVNPISFDDELIRMERRALEFVWRGSDDLGAETDIYTHKLFDGYWSPPGFCFGSRCSDPLLVVSDSLFNNVDERIDQFITQIRYRQSPHYNTRQVMVVMGQRHGYFDAKIWFNNIDTLIQKFNERTYQNNEKMHAIYSMPACFLKAVYEENPILETKQDDFFPYAYKKNTYTTGMYTTRPTFKYLVRESNIFLQIAKQLQVLMNLGNYDKMFENFNWIMGVVQDHNIISGAMRDHVASYYAEKLHSAVQWSTELLQDAFNKIRRSTYKTDYRLCYLNISSCPNTKLDTFYITIYNPLAWPVTMPVRLPITNTKYEVFDPSGTQIKAIKIAIPGHVFDIPNRKIPVTNELVFIAENIPPLGLRGYFIQKETKTLAKRSIIKKISKTQQKKYYMRQTAKENKSYIEQSREYDDFDETKPATRIEFDKVVHALPSGDEETDLIDVEGESTNKTGDGIQVRLNNNSQKVDESEMTVVNSNESIKIFDETQVSIINSQSTSQNSLNNSQNVDESEMTNGDNETNIKIFDKTQVSHKNNESTRQNIDETEITNVDKKFEIEVTTMENIEVIHPGIMKNTIENVSSTEKTVQDSLALSIVDTLNKPKFKKWVPADGNEKPDDISSSELNIDDYYAKESKDYFIRNQYIQINLDEYRKITSMNLSNGVNTSLDIQYYYYISDEPTDNTTWKPGAYIFRAVDTKPEPIIDFIETKVYKSDIVEEIHTKYSNYASFAVKLYTNNPIIEIDWVTGPIPIEDNFGKEVFIRYTTDLENEGVFYTDANGRQMVKRIRHLRPMYEPYDLDPIAGNFYPVTSRIYIEDPKRNLRFSIFNDRSQGASSLLEGSIDLMVHRRILTDTSASFIIINETEYNKGLIVRGNHYLYLTKANYKQNRVYEKKIAKEIELKPQIMFNRITQELNKEVWLSYNNDFTCLNKRLPIGVHILTLQEWNARTILLRLENYLEKIDAVKSGIKKVYIKDLFVNIKVLNLIEMNLAANMFLKDNVKLNWRVNGSFVKNFNDFYGSNGKIEYSNDEMRVVDDVDLDSGIILVPQQIRTFVIGLEA
ncbi:lysosomal alpha-mannosidase-like [Maniola hyperantus]|uniref:lysosomal alpha-mannosidase-like n=1 Tax=Aphantopus hyperantus TaxID=2795564 RepID=UPI003749E135